MTKEELEQEIKATVAELPQMPTDEIVSQVHFELDAMVYRSEMVTDENGTKRRMARVTCTACGASYHLEQEKKRECGCSWSPARDVICFIDPSDFEKKHTGSRCVCRSCGKKVTALHVGDIRGYYMVDSRSILSLHNVRGHLALLVWVVEKYVDKEAQVSYMNRRDNGAVFVCGTPVRLAGYISNMGCDGLIRLGNWERRKKWIDSIRTIEKTQLAKYNPQTIYDTDCEKSGLHEYLQSSSEVRPASYLRLWCRYPQVENLVKQGMGGFVNKMMEECIVETGYYYNPKESFLVSSTKRYVNWKEKKPHRMLGLEKPELWIAKKYIPDVVNVYKKIKEQGTRLTMQQLDLLNKLGVYSFHTLTKEPFHGYTVPMPRLLTYLQKQKEKQPSNRAAVIDGTFVRDYWENVFKVYGEMKRDLLYPRDIIAAHDNMMVRVKEKEDEELNRKIAETLVEREKFCFRDENLGLMIFPARSHAELIEEGKQLHHCVAGYAKSHAEGKTTIFFIRKIEQPDKPFFTLEYKDGKVQQNRGFKNCARTPEVSAFEEEWKRYIKEMKEKEKNERNRNHSHRRKNTDKSCA